MEKHTETDSNETYDAAVSSCQGWRFSQEDDHSLKLVLPGEHKAAFFAVFDGHGSAKVSKHAAESLWRHITENELYIKGNFKEGLEQAFLSFDREVFESYNAQLAGTTATSVLIVDNVIYCANIGDSRSVASLNCKCVPLSHDHKPDNPPEMKRILAAGGYVLGSRVNGNLALSRAFGDFHYKSNEQLPPDQQIVSPFPEIERIELTDDVDFILLACDGIWDVLTSEEVVDFVISRLEHEVRPDQICEQLTTRCLATDYELVIGCDNMTVLLVCYTRGMSWSDYCTEIFNRNTKRLGLTNRKRELDKTFGNDTTTFQHPKQRDDDTTQETERLISSTSRDQSSEPSTDSLFRNSQDPAWKSMVPPNPDQDMNAGRQAAVGRAMDELFYLLQTGRLPSDAQRDLSDDTPPISEVPAEEVVTIHDDDDSSVKPPDADSSTTNDSTQQAATTTTITTETEETDKSERLAGDESAKEESEANSKISEPDENLISSGTAEININDDQADEENLPDESEIAPIDLANVEKEDGLQGSDEPEVSQNVVEIELGAPDDAPDAANIQPEEESGQNNEIDEGINVEASAEDGGEVGEEDGEPSEEPQDDTNDDANGDTSEES